MTLGSEVLKSTARKLRRLYNDKILAGFAGSTADALSLTLRFEAKLEQFNGNLPRAVVELARNGEPTKSFVIWKRFCWSPMQKTPISSAVMAM